MARTKYNNKHKESPYTKDELHRKTICLIMQGDQNIKPTSMLQWTVAGLKTGIDNLDIIHEAINVEKQTIAGTLSKVRHIVVPGRPSKQIATIDEFTGTCILDRRLVRCRPALGSEYMLKQYHSQIVSLNETYSNAPLPEVYYEVKDKSTANLSSGYKYRFVSSMGLVPNKRMTDQSNFSRKCEFGSLTHETESGNATHLSCILGRLITPEDTAKVSGKYRQHVFYERYIKEALESLKIQSEYETKKNMDISQRMQEENDDTHYGITVEYEQTHAPVVIYTAHAMLTINRSTNRIIHEFDNARDYALPGMNDVFRTVADINLTTVSCAPYTKNVSEGFLKRVFNNDHCEFILAQTVNYKCTYYDKQKVHMPDVEFKITTINHGETLAETTGISAVVFEFGNGPATQFDIVRNETTTKPATFFGFGTQIASEVIHQSMIDALHDIVKRKDSVDFPNLFGKWNVGTQLQTLIFNLKKNITPYNKKTDDPELIFGKRLDISFSTREFGLIAYGTEEREIGRLRRAELVVLLCAVARSFDTPDLKLWSPEWDIPAPPMSPVLGPRAHARFGTLGSVYSNSSCGMTMEEIMQMACMPSEFDD